MNCQIYKEHLLQFVHPDTAETVEQAYSLMEQHMSTLFRRTGESYVDHCLEVATVLTEVSDDPTLIIVAIVHDLLLHPDGKEIVKGSHLSSDQKKLLFHMHDLRRLHIDQNINDLDTVIDAFSQDSRLLSLRMAHRLTDIRNFGKFSSSLKREIAHETLHMYSAIAGRLGMHEWRREMEDICFQYLQPKIAKTIQEQYAVSKEIDLMCIEHAKDFLEKECNNRGIQIELKHRIKSLYSTYRKMVLKNRTFDELTDRLAIRILVPDIESCYKVLGIVHGVMNPIPGKLKDYIGAPKENGYRSIHTVAYPLPGITEVPIELQIRTKNMEQECEYGVGSKGASHTTYKSYQYAISSKESRVNLFRNLEELREKAHSPQEFETALRTYFTSDHLVIFDAENRAYHTPKYSTILDYMCIHNPKKIAQLKEVKLNGRVRSLDATLADGDIVEVHIGRKKSIAKRWSTYCYLDSSKELIKNLTTI